jgi:hypothetical protein
LITTITLTSLFFPSATFGLISAEVFPYALLVSLLYIRRMSWEMIFIIGILLASSLYALFYAAMSGLETHTDVTRSLATYLNVFLLTQALLNMPLGRVKQLMLIVSRVLFFLLFLGILQLIGLDFVGSIIKFIIPRGEGSALTESHRGVTLMATEPARAGVELVLVYSAWRLLCTLRRTRAIALDILFLLYVLVVVKSATALFFALVAIAIINFELRSFARNTFIFAITFVCATYMLSSTGNFASGRVTILASALIESNIDEGTFFFLANESGNRVLSIYAFIKAGFSHLFGFGVGLWQTSSVSAVIDSGLPYQDFRFFEVVGGGNLVPFRGSGLISNLMLDVGLIGTLTIGFLFFRLLLRCGDLTDRSKRALCIFLFKVSLIGSPGNPIVFVFFILIFRLEAFEKEVSHQKNAVNGGGFGKS